MSRVKNVYDWYSNNKENDPNLYELVEVLCDASKDGTDNNQIEALVKLEVDRMISNGIVSDENDCLVRMIKEVMNFVLEKHDVSDEFADYVKKVVGVAFWLKQENRGKEKPTLYNNYDEYRMLLKLENDFDNAGEKKSPTLKELSDFIAGSYQEIRVPRKQELPNYRESLSSNRDKYYAMINDVLPYIYPQEAEGFARHWKNGGPLAATVNGIIDFEVGIDPKIVLKRLEREVDGFGYGFAKSLIIMYSKNGPDFANSIDESMDEKTVSYLNELRAKKEEYRLESLKASGEDEKSHTANR